MKHPTRIFFLGLILIVLGSVFYAIQHYVLPRQHQIQQAEQQQNNLWLKAFDALELTTEQKIEIKQKLASFDRDTHQTRSTLASSETAMQKTALSHASHQQKLTEADEQIASLFAAMINLKEANFYHLREIYFKVLTPAQQAKFIQLNPVILKTKAQLAGDIKKQIPAAFAGLKLSSDQQEKILELTNLNKIIDLAYQKSVINYRLYSMQFLAEINKNQIKTLFAQLYNDYMASYNYHKQQYEKIYSDILTTSQRAQLSDTIDN